MEFEVEFEVIRSDRRTLSAEIRQGKLLVRAPLRASDAEINAFLLKYKDRIEKHLTRSQTRQQTLDRVKKLTPEELRALAESAAREIPGRVRYYAPLIGVTWGRITIRSQRSKWGSCSEKGNLNFNCLLMLAPPEVLDSVVVHELCHRKEMNHSEKFYAEVLRVFPDYDRCHKWLKDNGDILMRRLP